MLMEFCTPEYTEALLRRLPQTSSFYFTHADLLPRNILVDGSVITGIVDWNTAGFYPEF